MTAPSASVLLMLLAGLLASCAPAPRPAAGYEEVKCQLGRLEEYTSERQCVAMGGTVLRRSGY